MNTITRDWLKQKISDMEAARDEIPFGLDEDDSNTLAAMRIALASLEAEVVAFRSKLKPPSAIGSERWDYTEHRQPDAFELENCVIERLFTAPPAQKPLKDHKIPELVNELRDIAVEYHGTQQLRERIARTVHAAMLQSSDGNSPMIPDGWVMVPVEPTEDMIVNGFESEPDESFSDEKEWEAYDAMSGCQQAAHRAKLCWQSMIAAVPKNK